MVIMLWTWQEEIEKAIYIYIYIYSDAEGTDYRGFISFNAFPRDDFGKYIARDPKGKYLGEDDCPEQALAVLGLDYSKGMRHILQLKNISNNLIGVII
jgi:hypothetical protein